MDQIIATILTILCGLTLLGATSLTCFSVWHSLKKNRRPKIENGVPTQNILLGTIALVIIIALPTLIFGSFTDMCIITGIMMLFAATITIIYSRFRSIIIRKNV